MNNVTLVGRLTKAVDLRYTPNGVAVASGTIAVPHDYKDEQGNRGADFINIVIWRGQAENTANHTEKGQRVAITGKLKSRNYEAEQGHTVWVTEVHADNVEFLDKPQGVDQQGNNNQQYNNNNNQYNNNNNQQNNNNNRNNNNQNRNNNNNNYNNNRNNNR
ncbi:single-stranded DNA-binding protein [Bacillus wiedmannii]|uniref:Single-stranded DNA-binding protein n=1 Tax=Bacillus wiedmannii TaxID=1890302 RepID=A0A2A7VQJ6_9BACI|nr:single-stranded DNA-binding protein [Bacillus wiedmannii]PEI99645.1 single-stranded DNA-binding protein [Bacillus wiedmannii]